MVFKLYGFRYSTCTMRVMIVLKETKTPFEFVEVNPRAGEHKSPAYVEKQPFGQAPYIDDEGFVLFESRSITRYIASKANSPLLPSPSDLKKRALFETAASIEAFNFDPYASGIVFQRVILPRHGGKPDEARVTELTTALEGKMVGYEKILGKQTYFGGEEISLADLAHIPYGNMLAPQGVKFLEDEVKFPNVARWWKDITSRPSWKEVAPPQ